MDERARERWKFWLLALLWLPAGLVLQAAVRFGGEADGAGAAGMWLMTMLMAISSLIFVAPCGLPLALGCRRLWRLGYPRAAWGWGIGLGAVTVATSVLAGLLGPVAIVVVALVLSLPVWIAGLVLARISHQGP